MGLGVRVGRGANVKQTMLYYNVYYMFFHSSSLQDRRYFFLRFSDEREDERENCVERDSRAAPYCSIEGECFCQ